MILLKRCIHSTQKLLASEATKKLIKNSSWLISDKLITMIIGLFVMAIIARYFGPEQYGQFNYALAFISLFTALSTLGLETLIVRSLVDDDFDEGTILCTSLVLRVFGGIFLTVFATIIIIMIEPNDRNLHLLVILMSTTMIFKSFEVIEYWIQAHQQAKISTIIRVAATIISSILKVVLVAMDGDLVFLTAIYVLDVGIVGGALCIVYFIIRKTNSPWKISIRYAKHILSESWYLILSGLMVTLYMRVDQVMLGYMLSTRSELGIYSASTRIAEMWYFVPMAVIVSFKPVIMSKRKTDLLSYTNAIQMLYTIVAWMSISFGVAILLFSKSIISILYGEQYMDAAGILTLNVWAGTFAMLGSARSVWLICEGLQKYTIVYALGGFIVNISLNFILIPKFGAYGAAFGTLVSQFSANIIILALFKETRISSIMILKSFFPTILWNYRKKLRGR